MPSGIKRTILVVTEAFLEPIYLSMVAAGSL